MANIRKRKKRRKVSRKRRRKNLPQSVLYGMAFLAFLACSTLLFYAYHSQEGAQAASTDTSQSSQDTTTITFIQTIGETARQIAAQNDLYASVMIAQAVLESNSGQSALSQPPYYNFFGIKGDYNGQTVTMKTWEDDGSGNAYTIDAQFRSYGSLEESLQDYAQFLQKDLYAGVHKSQTTSYQEATAALTGTYATDTSYGDKLNQIISEYDLTIYDSW